MSGIATTIDMCVKGGVFMIPLGVVALIAIALFIERLIYLHRNKINGDKFHFELRSALKDNTLDQAIVLAARTKGMIGRVIGEGLQRIKDGESDIEAATEKVILSEMVSIEKSRGWLVNMSQIAPLLGILGTVWGLVVAFIAIERTSGIYQALITTVAGLLIAIPVLIALEYIRKETNQILHLLDIYLAEIKEWLGRRGRAVSNHG
jgi:biopolymer transport protein ExbB